jgi:hypothetical protein
MVARAAGRALALAADRGRESRPPVGRGPGDALLPVRRCLVACRPTAGWARTRAAAGLLADRRLSLGPNSARGNRAGGKVWAGTPLPTQSLGRAGPERRHRRRSQTYTNGTARRKSCPFRGGRRANHSRTWCINTSAGSHMFATRQSGGHIWDGDAESPQFAAVSSHDHQNSDEFRPLRDNHRGNDGSSSGVRRRDSIIAADSYADS